MTAQQASQLKTELITKHKNGATLGLDYVPRQFRNGYAVSLTDNPIRRFVDITPSALRRKVNAIKRMARVLRVHNPFIGFWMDERTKTAYLDLTVIVQSKNVAMNMARVFGQKAIFNFRAMQSIYL